MKKVKISILAFAFGAFVMSCSNSETEHETETHETEVTETHEEVEEVVSAATVAKDVDADEFKSLFESGNGTLLDVRTAGEVANGAIEGSVNIDFNGPNFKEEVAKLDKSKPVYVYCAAGGRSGQAMNMMKDMGFSEVYNLVGGYGNWPFK